MDLMWTLVPGLMASRTKSGERRTKHAASGPAIGITPHQSDASSFLYHRALLIHRPLLSVSHCLHHPLANLLRDTTPTVQPVWYSSGNPFSFPSMFFILSLVSGSVQPCIFPKPPQSSTLSHGQDAAEGPGVSRQRGMIPLSF